MSKSVPQLSAQTTPDKDDLVHIVRNNIDYKMTNSNFQQYNKTTSNIDAYSAITLYDNTINNYAVYGGKLWKYINASPSTGTTPVEGSTWTEVYVADAGHIRNKDMYLDRGGDHEVSAEQLPKIISKTLTASEIKTLNSTPIDLGVAAPGAGKVIMPIHAFYYYTYASAAFDNNTSLRLMHDTASSYLMEDQTNVLQQTASRAVNMVNVVKNATQIVANKKLYITSNADSVAGGGAITLYVTYQVVTL